MADFNFGEAAQNMIDKIQSGTGPGESGEEVTTKQHSAASNCTVLF